MVYNSMLLGVCQHFFDDFFASREKLVLFLVISNYFY